ncbi:MAG: hypothetical protein KDD02_17175 [Phaeodactylibacter sp.]|nr:hypothetical protein [Phaeodactylibacter sp.]MCB9303705.1 hypothetical protein [Lewinellaceae bacterium]
MKQRKIKIKGKVVYQKLGTGFWGIIGEDGREWRPVKMPEQLKYEGKTIEVEAAEVDEEASIFMWGTPVRITSFQTLMP